MKRLLAVLGRDVSRSLSPVLHTAAAEALGIDLAYVPISCADEAHFVRAVRALETIGALGCNVTIPYKVAARQLATTASDLVVELHAANTLSFGARGVVADNTDAPGLLRVLEPLPDSRFERVQILGAGGAARAAMWAARRRGARELHVLARGPSGGVAPTGPLAPLPGATLVISALPGTAALADRVVSEWLDSSAKPLILDLAYGGIGQPSPLVARVAALGLEAIDGLSMLVEQAALAFARWTDADAADARAAMYARVRASG